MVLDLKPGQESVEVTPGRPVVFHPMPGIQFFLEDELKMRGDRCLLCLPKNTSVLCFVAELTCVTMVAS
jgi:hypothetical protein